MATSDSSAIKFVGHPDAETYLALIKCVHPQKTWSTSGLVLIVLVAFAAIGVLLKNGIPVLVDVVAIVFLIGFFSLLPTVVRRQIEKRQKRAYAEAMPKLERSGLVSPQGIYIKSTDCQTELEWSHFDRAAEIDGAIGLCKGREVIDAISRSMFESDSVWYAAKKMVLENVPNGFKNSRPVSR